MAARKNSISLGFCIVLGIALLGSCGRSVEKRYSKDGVLLEEAQMKNGVCHGEYIEYYNNGNKKMTCNYENGKFHGKMVEYDSLGRMISETYYVDGYKEGRKITYFANGTIMEEIDYKEGWMNGEKIRYHQNGKTAKYALYLKDEEVYYRTYDTAGIETFQYSKIVITPDSDTLPLGKFFRAKVEFFGPFDDLPKIGARLASKPMTQENIELIEMSNEGPYYITFLADRIGQNYLTIKLALERHHNHVRVLPIYVQNNQN